MTKNNFYNLDNTEKEAIFQAIASKKGMTPFAVEKDWWVTQLLSVIFKMEIADYMIFKGGTSLSKAWKIIDRFSEDIDLAIDRSFFDFDGDISVRAVGRLRKTSNEFIINHFYPSLQKHFEEKGFRDIFWEIDLSGKPEEDPVKIFLSYPKIISSPGYMLPAIQIELGCRSLREPYTVKTFGSLVDEMLPDKGFSTSFISVPTANPEKTFLEKLFLLHEEFHRPPQKIRVNRLSRHLYDVFHLSKTIYATKALEDEQLYKTIVAHRYKFSRVGGVDYNKHHPNMLNPIPIKDVINVWKMDYAKMLEEMIYEENAPTFEDLIDNLSELRHKLQSIKWDYDLIL